MPWHDQRDKLEVVLFYADTSDVDLCMDYWFYNTKSQKLEFANGSVSPVSIGFLLNGSVNMERVVLHGMDPSRIRRWSFAFSGMPALKKIVVDSSWELPQTMETKSNTFYGDTSLVGGNGTAFSSSKTSADYAVIDKDGQEGYLTAG